MRRQIKIIIAPHTGYCFGVKRAMRIVEEGLAQFGAPLFTLGDIIHNPPEVERLREKGIRSVSDLAEVPEAGTLVLRAHGVPLALRDEAKKKRIRILDATCPFVQRSQQFARKASEEERRVIVIGDAEHPEVISVAAYSRDAALIIRDTDEARRLPSIDRAGVVIQTTFSRKEADAIIAILKENIADLEVYDTICEATEARRKSALEIAARVGLMLIVGGHNSSNTRRLHEACSRTGVKAYLVESPEEIVPDWLMATDKVGIVTGTSTPDWLINAVLDRIRSICDASY